MTHTNSPIRIGVVGAGANTRERHLPGLRALPGVELVSVCNRRPESSVAASRDFEIPAVYESWEELVAAPDTNAIVIGTWPYLHAPVTLAALAAGKHVLCEARMAMNLDEARRMLAAARARPDCVAQVVPAPFTLAADATARRLIDDGALGEILSVVLRANTGAFLDRDGPLGWRRDERLSGENIMSLGIWYETLMRWVGEARQVAACGRVFVPERTDPATGAARPVRIPEHLDVMGTLANGAALHMQVSAVHGLVPENEILIFGSEGTLRFTGGTLSLGRPGATSLQPVPLPPAPNGDGWRVEEAFVHAIRGLEPVSLTTFETGVRYMAFTDAVQRALREARTVEVAAT